MKTLKRKAAEDPPPFAEIGDKVASDIEMGAQLGSSVAFSLAVGKRFRGFRAKRLYVHFKSF